MENILIFRHIYLDKFFLFFLLIIILTGNFNGFIPYFLLLLIHELSHAITGIILGYKLLEIIIYPLGGVTIFDFPLNIPLKQELLILIMGPIGQILGYLVLKKYFPFISVYHYTLLIFNLLPMYPLDGGKILNIVCSYFFNYLVSFNITFIMSIIMIFGLFIYNIYFFNLNLFFMLIMILIKIIKIYRKRFFYYNRFLLERYLHNYSFHKIKNINKINNFYRDRLHFINFTNEKKVLKKYFEFK